MVRERTRETSIYKTFLQEKERIDLLIKKGYEITAVEENLSGAFVEFSRINENNQRERERLHLTTADARIYFSNLL